MAKCEVCGKDYDIAFQVVMRGSEQPDKFEDALYTLTPTCESCGITIVGQGVEANGVIFCSAHCAEREGIMELGA